MSEDFHPPQTPVGLLLETAHDPRLERLFSPVPTAEEAQQQETPDNYDFIFKDEGQYQAALSEAQQKAVSRETEASKYTVVTGRSRAEAVERLKKASTNDPAIQEILARYQERSARLLKEVDFVDAVRKDAGLRYELGEYLLLEKLPRRLHMMPDRIVRDTEKTPNHRGYRDFGKLSSQDYVVLLSLAMLDGSFQDPGADRVHRNVHGEVELGQHRAAAEELLS